ncbi:hypothetical protein CHEID_03485 [Corynebacterium heidelbergense]|nr:hypothetical protein CHEID_03485 [Corynebacterium heidelbergense]
MDGLATSLSPFVLDWSLTTVTPATPFPFLLTACRLQDSLR